MNKSTGLILSALLLSGSAYAATPDFRSMAKGSMSSNVQSLNKLRGDKLANPYEGTQPAKAPTRAQTVITEAPEGKVIPMYRSGAAYYTFFGDPTWGDYYGMCSEIVECDNGDIYLKDPISMAPSYSYIKGRRDGSQVYFNMPQEILSLHYEDGSLLYFYTSMFQYSTEYGWFFRANSNEAEEVGLPEIENELVLEIAEDGSYYFSGGNFVGTGEEDEEEGMLMLGLYSDETAESDMGSWLMFGEIASAWEVFNDEPVTAPEGIEYESMAMHYEDGAYFVSVGFDGNDVYFKGLFNDLPQSVVKGSLDGDKIIIYPGQYVGVVHLESGVNYYGYVKTATADRTWNTQYSMWQTVLYPQESFVFNYDKDTNALTSSDENGTLVLNCGNAYLSDAAYVLNPSLSIQGEGLSMTPADPCNVEFVTGLGTPHMTFDLPVININGDVLDINNLYYKIYIDGEEFIFYSDEYPEIPGDEMAIVPYTFATTDQDFIVYGKSHTVYFYMEDVETYGVQLLYVEDGEVLGESKVITIAAEMDEALTPANPYDMEFSPNLLPFGIYTFRFRFPDLNVNNEKLPQEYLYYKLYINGEEYTIYPEDYSAVVEPMTFVPYQFNDDKDYKITVTGSIHGIDLPNADGRTYGVQLFYIKDDIIYGKSDLVTISGPNYQSGVKEIAEDSSKEIVGVKYYNVSGSEISEPQQGLFIRVETYSDGSSRGFKEIK